MSFVPSDEIIILAHQEPYRLTKAPKHEDYTVWKDGRVITQGGRVLMERVFKEKILEQSSTA